MSPYLIQGPALLSVSGGLSSGYNLAHVLEAHSGKLPDDIVCVFANTGEEHEGTLAFVREMAERWAVQIRWVEFAAERNPLVSAAPYSRWREVTYCTASRKGEPFDAMVGWKQYLPNHDEKLCTEWLKVRAMHGLMASLGYDPGSREKGKERDPNFEEVIGIRADEPIRVAKGRSRASNVMPLVDAGICRGDVRAWWAEQPFGLRIPAGAGNCVVCFEKGHAQLHNVIRDGTDGGGARIAWSSAKDASGRQ